MKKVSKINYYIGGNANRQTLRNPNYVKRTIQNNMTDSSSVCLKEHRKFWETSEPVTVTARGVGMDMEFLIFVFHILGAASAFGLFFLFPFYVMRIYSCGSCIIKKKVFSLNSGVILRRIYIFSCGVSVKNE